MPINVQAHNDGEVADMVDKVANHPRPPSEAPAPAADTPPATTGGQQQQAHVRQAAEAVQHDERETVSPEVAIEGVAPLPGADGEENNGLVLEPAFPIAELAKLDEMVGRPRWIVPVLPRGELEVLLRAALDLCRKGLDTRSEACQRFFREGLTTSFTKVLTDEAVSGWKLEIQLYVLDNCKLLIDICACKLLHDWFPLLDLLAIAFNPNVKFHIFNASRVQTSAEEAMNTEGYARAGDVRSPKNWLVELINRFGQQGGFMFLVQRFERAKKAAAGDTSSGCGPLNLPLACALIKPFGLCFEYLSETTMTKYLVPVLTILRQFLEGLTDEELKKESTRATSEAKNDLHTAILRSVMCLISRLPHHEDAMRDVEMFKLKMILRLLKISSFNGKMNALNEVNKVITNATYCYQRHNSGMVGSLADDETWLTAENVATWIKENDVLDVVLRDNLHQPQYVEKLEKIVRFMLKERALEDRDLLRIWEAQQGKHEAIVKNVHELLAKLAWDFTADQLECLFKCVQDSWHHANKKQRERLLELIRRLAEDDKDGIMAQKVLGLLWSLACSSDCPTDIMDQALTSFIKILDFSCSQDREQLKVDWIHRLVEELKKNERYVLPSLKQIREICQLFPEAPPNHSQMPRPVSGHVTYRKSIINDLQQKDEIMDLVTGNLTKYMDRMVQMRADYPNKLPSDFVLDNHYGHSEQISERLRFLRFLLKDGHMRLSYEHAEQIWHCLTNPAVFDSDREACFKWFTKLMGDEPYLLPGDIIDFFTKIVLRLDPTHLTEFGMNCFDRFFRFVNTFQKKLKQKRKGGFVVDDLDLVGIEYIWRVVLHGSNAIAEKGICVLKDIYTNLGPQLLPEQMAIHKNFIDECYERLRASHDSLKVLAATSDTVLSVNRPGGAAGDGSSSCGSACPVSGSMATEETRMVRVLTVLREYVSECDDAYAEERLLQPLHRASHGKHMLVIARVSIPSRQPEDCELTSHSNDTMGSLRRQLHQNVRDRFKCNISQVKIEIYHNNEIVDTGEDKKLVTSLGIRDKSVLNVKLCQLGSPGAGLPAGPSHSESSSEDSSPGGSPRPRVHAGPSREAEHFLPGVILANETGYVPFLLTVADTGGSLRLSQLRNAVRSLLKLVPPHTPTMNNLKDMSMQSGSRIDAKQAPQQHGHTLLLERAILGGQSDSTAASPAQVLYNLEIVYALLMPALSLGSEDDSSSRFQLFFMDSGGVALILKIISNNDFLETADAETRRSAYLVALRIAKLVVVTVAYATVYAVVQATSAGAPSAVPSDEYQRAVQLQQALHCIPPLDSDYAVRSIASLIAQRLVNGVGFREHGCSAPWYAGGTGQLPDVGTVRALLRLAWAAAGGSLQLCSSASRDADLARALEEAPATGSSSSGDEVDDDGDETVQVACEAIDMLTVCLVFCPTAIDVLQGESAWQSFVVGAVLICPSRTVRYSSCEQLYLISTRCSGSEQSNPSAVTSAMAHLFTVLESECIRRYAKQSYEFFNLLCLLMSSALSASIEVPAAEKLLSQEVAWLKQVRAEHIRQRGVSDFSAVEAPEESLLEGHLNVARQLVLFMSAEKKYLYGGDQPDGKNLVKELMDDFIFASARKPVTAALPEGVRVDATLTESDSPPLMQPICSTSRTIRAAYELLVALCTNCVQNLRAVSDSLTQMYYSGTEPPLTEWEYMPPVGARPFGGFVGLKNGGATCYMNSVLQQLYMIAPVFEAIVSTEGAICDGDEELEEPDDHLTIGLGDDVMRQPTDSRSFPGEGRSPPSLGPLALEPSPSSSSSGNNVVATSRADSTRAYNLAVLKHVQLIFAHLAFSKLQFYVPRGFWKHFRLQGEPVNLREQHDALEFFNSLVDSLDEALKSIDQPPMLSRVLGGTYADQKICKDCPHRYSIEQPFTALNVDIRNHQHLKESLEQFVKGDLLEGANAYYCEHCGKKVDTVKRLCVKKLPKMLVIQLKRFDYDWERECAIKFNDYFEFPRDLDMEPYTVYGLARMEGEKVPDEEDSCIDQKTAYRLVGVVVHSGQASGGHYYSYIQHRPASGLPKWYKFDDGDVSECKMDDDEEMKNQCFGGDYMGEVYDHSLKRMNIRRQKRWWNAYLLFYEQIGNAQDSITHQMNEMSLSTFKSSLKIPRPIERVVRKQNVEFMHNRNQFSHEYFNFLRSLLNCNIGPYLQARQQGGPLQPHPQLEELSMLSIQLAARFLFSVGYRTKKTLRGSAGDWCDIVNGHLGLSRAVRHWFAVNALFNHPYRFTEYLLESPSAEVRNVFGRMLAYLAHVSLQDGPCPLPRLPTHVAELEAAVTSTVSDHVLLSALGLLRKEVLDNGRHTAQYFQLFVTYAHMGHEERRQLLRLNVLATFMAVALDESPGQPFKCQYSEFSKLCSVVSALMRCCDLSQHCEMLSGQKPALANPHGDTPLLALPSKAAEMLYNKPTFVKKLIEENNSSDDTVKLLLYVCWENMMFSRTLISELLWQIAYSYTYELRPYLDLLLRVLIMEDSWQMMRLELAVCGIPDDRDGLLDTIQISKNHYQKRGYQCIKMMVNLFGRCSPATQLLHQKADVEKKWQDSVEWLNDELERRPHPSTQQYTYNNWSPPATSNETSNSYFLERSNSARSTLSKAIVFCTGDSKSSSGTTGDEKLDDDAEVKNDTSTSQDEFHSASPSPNKSSSLFTGNVTILRDNIGF